MSLIRCTAKLLKEMGLSRTQLAPAEPVSPRLGPWHANLIYIDRRKCVLFVNDKTLFNFVVPDLKRAQIRDLAAEFRLWLSCVIRDEGLDEATVSRILSEYETVTYDKTNNRSVLSSMNELAWHYQYAILEAGGVHSPRVPAIIRASNRTPLKAIGYGYPVEKLKEDVKGVDGV